MADYTQNQNGLFNNNSTSQLTGNTVANTVGNTTTNATGNTYGNTTGTSNVGYTQNQALPGAYQAGLQQLFGVGGYGIQNIPTQTYGGPFTAGQNYAQASADGRLRQLAGFSPQMVTPDSVTQYAGGTGAGGLGLNGANLSGYMNPYTSQVINTSLDQINRQLAQANQATAGNAALSGAFGGDRAAIMQSENMRNANDIAAQTIANLNSQNFTQAQAQANTDISRQLQAGTTQAQLGLSAGQGNQLAGLQGANLGLSATNALTALGNRYQDVANQDAALRYQDWVRATQTQPAQIAQMQLQAGLAGLPYLVQRSGTQTGTQSGTSNTGQNSTQNTLQNLTQNTTQNTNQTGTQSSTSSSNMTGTGPQPSVLSQVAGGIGTAAGLGGLLFAGGGGGGAAGLVGGLGSLYNNTLGSNGLNLFGSGFQSVPSDIGSFASDAPYLGGDGTLDPGSFADNYGSFSDFGFSRGGLVGYADGGDVDEDSFLSAYDDAPDEAYSFNFEGGAPAQVAALPAPPDRTSVGQIAQSAMDDPPSRIAMSARPDAPTPSMAPAPAAGLGAGQQSGNPYIQDDAIGRTLTGTGGNSWALPVLAAGLATLAGKSPHAMQNIGQGGLAALQTLQGMGQNRARMAQAWQEQQLGQAKLGLMGEKLEAAKTQNQINRALLPAQLSFLGEDGGGGTDLTTSGAGSSRAAAPVLPALASLPSPDTQELAIKTAKEAGLPNSALPYWISAVQNESSWNLNAPDGKAGEIGPGQVMPGTGKMLGYTPEQLRDPQTNLLASAKYFAQKWQESGGNPKAALIGYNSGSVNGKDTGYADQALQSLNGLTQQDSTPTDAAALASVRRIRMMQNLALARGNLAAAATLEARLNQISGRGATVVDSGRVAPVPGAIGTQFALNQAESAGSASGRLPSQMAMANYNTNQAIQRAAGVQAAELPFKPPIQMTVKNPDGTSSQVAVSPAAYAQSQMQGVPFDPKSSPGAVVGQTHYTPEQEEQQKALGGIQKEIIDESQNAREALPNLQVLRNALQNFRPGTTGDPRLAWNKALVDGLQMAGIKVPQDVLDKAAAGETIEKVGGFLANGISRAMGSREAASVVQQNMKIMPNIRMSEGGYNVVINSLAQDAQRKIDMDEYRQDWLKSHSSIDGMMSQFNKDHPVEAYASRVLPQPMPKSKADAKPNVIYNTQRGPARWDGQQFISVQ